MEAETKTIVLTSKDSIEFFPSNNPSQFTSIFGTLIELNYEWVVSLREMVIKTQNSLDLNIPVILDIYCRQASGIIQARQ